VSVDNRFWDQLVELNKKTDALISRVRKFIEPDPGISREIMQVASVEVRWENLPTSYTATPSPNSDVLWGNNVKRGIFTNHGSRLLLRSIGFDAYTSGFEGSSADVRQSVYGTPTLPVPPYWRWNFKTSITQRQYADKPVSMRSLGRPESGSQLVFREPFILEPMETLTVECELLQYGLPVAGVAPGNVFTVNMNFFGYREGM
jgi:hypothetical protein